MNITKLSETATTITLGWTPLPGAVGYRFTSSAQAKPSHTWNPQRDRVQFAKGSTWYRVEALGVPDYGDYGEEQPPPPIFPGPTSLCLPRAQADFGVPTTGDAQPKFQAMIDQLRDGDAVAVETGLYTFNNPVRMTKSSLRVVGLGGQDKWFSDGVRIQPGRDNMTIFEDGHGSNVKHGGCTWEWINLGSQRPGTRGWDFRNVNHWKLIRCTTAHRMDRDGIYVDIPTSSIPAGDNAYVEIISHAARQSSGRSLNVWEGGTMRVEGGYFDAPGGIYIRQSGQVVMRDGKSNHEGRLLLIEGQLNVIENWGFEQYNSNGNPVYAVEILENGSLPVPWSGNENRLQGCMFVDHPHGSGKMLHIGPGCWGNIIDSFWQGGIGGGSGGPGQYFWDQGQNTQNRNPK